MSEFEIGIQVFGIKEAIKQLNAMGPEVRNEIKGRYKEIMAPSIATAKSRVPRVPLSGWQRRWKNFTPWSRGRQISQIKAGINTKKGRNNLSTFYMVWGNTYKNGKGNVFNTMYDMARNGEMSERLTAKHGASPSRVMWPAVEAHEFQIERDMNVLVREIMDRVNRKIA